MSQRFREAARVEVDGTFTTVTTPLANGTFYYISAAGAAFATPTLAALKASPGFCVTMKNDTAGAITLTGTAAANEFEFEGATSNDLAIAIGATVEIWFDQSAGSTGYLKVIES